MGKTFFGTVGGASALLLLLAASNGLACGTGGSTTITNLPTLGGSFVQATALNASGQVAGFSTTVNDATEHAFLFSSGLITDLGTLGGDSSEAAGINASGQVVGKSRTPNGQTHAALFSGGTVKDLGTLGGSSSFARGINNVGMVTGESDAGNGESHGFIYSAGAIKDLGTLGHAFSSVVGINSNGMVAGDSFTVDFVYHGYTYLNGIKVDIGDLGGGDYSSCMALNDAGVVVGESDIQNFDTHAFAYSGGVMTDLGTLGGTFSTAHGVNNAGQVIGQSTIPNGGNIEHGFIYSNNTMTDLGTLGGNSCKPYAINNLGQVVGESPTLNGDTHAFIWQNGSIVDLNTLLPANSGWQLSSAQFINDAGRIVGIGSFGGFDQWFVMDPGAGGNNKLPVAVAGPDQAVDCQAQVTLNGTGSSDPDGDALRFEWSENGTVLGTNATLIASFDLGMHVITLKVTDPCDASAQTNVTVTVTDTIAPTISCPGAITASADVNCQAVVPNLVSQVVASDNCTATGSLVINQNPTAGTLVGLGQHSITVTAVDFSGNSAHCSTLFTVTDTTPPVILGGPAPATISANTNCLGATPDVTVQIVAADNCTPANALVITQNPLAGTLLGLGLHSIVVTVKDAAGNSAIGSTSFTVADTTPPSILSVPAPMTVSSDNNCQGTVPSVVGSIVASDNCTPANLLVITQNPVAGTTLGLGAHPITVTVKDAAGNTSTANVSFTVVDTTAPSILSVPAPITASSDSNCQGTVPNLVSSVVASDNCTPANLLVVAQNPAAGTTLGLGAHLITMTVKDTAGNTSTANISFTVVDTTAPSILSSPASLTVSADANCQAAVPNVLASIVASDNCTPANLLVKTQTPAAGTILGHGNYTITVTVKDAAGNTESRNIPFTIADTTAPVIHSVTASPNALSPPNHQIVPITLSVVKSDNCDAAPVTKIISITSNEKITNGDITITGNLTAKLAATRNPAGNGRVYTVTVQCTDVSGNNSTGTVTVTVLKK